jgi:CheY-like chemotaxis protein
MSGKDTIRLLSIDDRTVTTDLDRAGYRNMGVLVKAAASYEEAQNYLSKGNIDIIVINMDYAGIDSLEATKHIKSLQEYNDLPVVLTSVQTSAGVRNSALHAGADKFIEQPLPRSYFIEQLKGLLEHKTRSNTRLDIDSQVEFKWDKNDDSCKIADLSNSGILLDTKTELSDGLVLNMKFTLPGDKQAVKVNGEVVRTIGYNESHPDRQVGVGIRFVEFKGDSESRLSKFIAMNNEEEENSLRYYL